MVKWSLQTMAHFSQLFVVHVKCTTDQLCGNVETVPFKPMVHDDASQMVMEKE